MRTLLATAFCATMLCIAANESTAQSLLGGFHEVTGVDEDDMLKMRTGPGTGYKVILGLPNGTQLRVHDCDQVGGTRWCEVSLRHSRKLKGFVSWHYLKES